MDNTVWFGILFCTASYFSTKLLKDLSKIQSAISTSQRTIHWGLGAAMLIQTVFGTSILFVSSFKGGISEQGLQCQIDGFATSTTTFAIINQFVLMCFASKVQIPKVLENNIGRFLALCWGVAVFLTCLPFFGIGKYIPHGNGSFCCLNWRSDNIYDQVYFYMMLLIAFIIPSLLIGYSRTIQRDNTDNQVEPDNQDIKEAVVFPVALMFLSLWVPFGGATMHSLSGFDTPGDVELLAVIFGLSSYVALPFILCRQLPRYTDPSTERYEGFEIRRFRVCLHFLLFL